MKKIFYTTAYDTNNTICGYVIPQAETRDYYIISKAQYKRALKNRTIGGEAGIIFDSEKPVYVNGIDF